MLKQFTIGLCAASCLLISGMTAPQVSAVEMIYTNLDSSRIKSSYQVRDDSERATLAEIDTMVSSGNFSGAEYLASQFIDSGPDDIERVRFMAFHMFEKFQDNRIRFRWLRLVADHPQAGPDDYLSLIEYCIQEQFFSNAIFYADKSWALQLTPMQKFSMKNLAVQAFAYQQDLSSVQARLSDLHEFTKQLPPLRSAPSQVKEAHNNLVLTSLALYDLEGDSLTKQHFFYQLVALNWMVKSDPENPEYYYKRGLINNYLDYHQAAIKDLSQAIRINPEHYEAYDQRIKIYEELNSPRAAIADYTSKIQTRQSQTGLLQTDNHFRLMLGYDFTFRGYLYLKVYDCQKALHDFMQGCSYGIKSSCKQSC